jgi:hypothetical protein
MDNILFLFMVRLLYLRKMLLRLDPWMVEWQLAQLASEVVNRECHEGAAAWQLKHNCAEFWCFNM